jgi:putative DNA primase/helicase
MAATIDQTLQTVLTATRAKPNQGGNGWKGHCPAHKDKSPSLSIDHGRNGGIILNCHAKCHIDSICAALNITQADLFPPKQPKTQTQGKPSYSIDKVYDYKDESGTLLFQAVRKRLTDPAKFPNEPRKQFRQRAPDGKGNWVWSLQGVRRILYRLPELLAANPGAIVWIVEGEKDVDRLRSLGLTATCNPMGAGKWLDEFSDFLVGHDCVIIEDNDDPGRAHAESVCQSLFGKAQKIRKLSFPNLPEHGDVSDWFDAGGDETTLYRLAQALPEWAPLAGNQQQQQSSGPKPIEEVCMADVEIKSIDWLWQNRIPRGTLTIVEGIEGEGKSTMLCAIGAAVTHGKGLADMPLSSPGNILWLSAEDDLGRVLKPRLLSVGADVARVFAVAEPFTFDSKGVDLVRQMAGRRQPVMIVIDPVFAYVHGDPSKGADARALTNQLRTLSEEFNCAIILVRHVGKSKGFGDPRAAGLYSIEWRAAARSVLLCGSDPDNPQRRALTQSKNTFGPMSDAIGYTIEKDPSSPTGAKFTWIGVSDLTASRILSGMATDDERAARQTACDLLKDGLSKGERLADDIKAEASTVGVSIRTLNRARADLGITWRREGFGKDAIYYWDLPRASNNGFHAPHTMPSEEV